MDELNDLRITAKKHGLRWRDVENCYREIKEREIESRCHERCVRETAWYLANASQPGVWPFWQHGFISRYGKKYAERDFTVIPGYDELAQEIATQFPEYGGDDGCERFWEDMMTPYRTLPSRCEMLRIAVDELVYGVHAIEDNQLCELEF